MTKELLLVLDYLLYHIFIDTAEVRHLTVCME